MIQRPANRMFTQLSQMEAQYGSVRYVRIDHDRAHPGRLLDGQTVFLAPGGQLDVVATADSAMGLDRVGYTPGLRAQRKLSSTGLLTYRFEVQTDASVGACYLVQCKGDYFRPGFSFMVQVA